MIVKRALTKVLERFSRFPAIAVLGPRQSGKTTLVRDYFNRHVYSSLEDPEVLAFVTQDPKRFLRENENAHGIIIDEFQHAPTLLSQGRVQTLEAWLGMLPPAAMIEPAKRRISDMCDLHEIAPKTALTRRSFAGLATGAVALTLMPLRAKASGKVEAMGVTCIDYRLVDDAVRFFDGLGLTNEYDALALAGEFGQFLPAHREARVGPFQRHHPARAPNGVVAEIGADTDTKRREHQSREEARHAVPDSHDRQRITQ